MHTAPRTYSPQDKSIKGSSCPTGGQSKRLASSAQHTSFAFSPGPSFKRYSIGFSTSPSARVFSWDGTYHTQSLRFDLPLESQSALRKTMSPRSNMGVGYWFVSSANTWGVTSVHTPLQFPEGSRTTSDIFGAVYALLC